MKKRISFNLEGAEYEAFRRICRREGKKMDDYLTAAVKAINRQKREEKPKLTRKEVEVRFKELE